MEKSWRWSKSTYDAIAKLTEFKTAIANAIDEAGGIKPDTTAETAKVNEIKEFLDMNLEYYLMKRRKNGY